LLSGRVEGEWSARRRWKGAELTRILETRYVPRFERLDGDNVDGKHLILKGSGEEQNSLGNNQWILQEIQIEDASIGGDVSNYDSSHTYPIGLFT
jgi:hypothetical protein